LKDFIESKASENGVMDWIRQENELLDQLDYSDVDHNGFIKEKDMSKFSESEWHIFKELLRWQDEMGEKYNRPAYQIVPKAYLIEIAKDSRKLMPWNQTDGIFKKLKSDDVKSDLIALIKSASSKKPKSTRLKMKFSSP
jgi:ribonuclease D